MDFPEEAPTHLIPYAGQVVNPHLIKPWGNSTRWTEERTAEAKRLSSEGYTAAQIASILNCGLSRNAVIGKLHRLGLRVGGDHRPKMRARKHSANKRYLSRLSGTTLHPQKVKAIASPRPDLLEPQSKHLDLSRLNGTTCKFPFGEGPYTFCGHTIWQAGPYCEFHKALSYSEGRG